MDKYSISEYVLQEFSNITPVYVNSITEALQTVATGRADATVVSMGTAQNIIISNSIQGLEFIDLYSQGLSKQHYGIVKDNPILYSILEKALASIDHEQRMDIFFKSWSTIEIAKVETVTTRFLQMGLTDKERVWLQQNPRIQVVSDPAWAPMEYIDENGKPVGISIDILGLIGDLLEVEFEFVPIQDWNEGMEGVKRKEYQLVSAISKNSVPRGFFTIYKALLQCLSSHFCERNPSANN